LCVRGSLIEDPIEDEKEVIEESDRTERKDIAAAELEAAILRALIPTYKILRKQEATHQATIVALSQPHNFFHFTGLGYHDSQNPQNSAIGLSDHPLTFKDITQLNLSPYRLINLAACETGITGKDTGSVSDLLKAIRSLIQTQTD
jgi:CHAT domain-containing protein